MDERDLFRSFRRGVAEPSAEAERRASTRLTRAIEGRHVGPQRLVRKRPGRITVALAALAGATAAALVVSSPWTSSPGFLERAQAALTPPAGSIIHYREQWTRTSADFGCTVTTGPNELWIDRTPPHRYRALLNDLPADPAGADPRALGCEEGTPREVGGVLDTQETLVFEPPNTLRASPVAFVTPWDPVGQLRDAIADGRAHHEGETQLDGRTVARIRLEPPPDCPVPGCERDSSYAYVDPETFAPVRVESPHAYIVPLVGRVLRFRVVVRYLTFEYLPRSAANVALTDIRAQHPDATGP